MEINELRSRLVWMQRRFGEIYGWIEMMVSLGKVSLERENYQNPRIRDEIDRRFKFMSNVQRTFFQKFFKGEIEVESSWKNQGRVVDTVTQIGAWELRKEDSKVKGKVEGKKRVQLKEEAERLFLYAKVFGPIKIPGSQKRERAVHKTSEFGTWIEASSQVGFHGIWRKRFGENILRVLAATENPPGLDLRPKSKVRDSAVEVVGLSDAGLYVQTTIFECEECGQKILSLGGGAPPRCSCENGRVNALARADLNYFKFDPLALEKSLHTGEIWESSQEKARDTIRQCRGPLDDPLNRYVGGILLSVFAAFLCAASGTRPTPSNIAKAATDEDYRSRLLEKAKSTPKKVSHRLEGKEKVRKVVSAFWSSDE